MSTPTGEQFTLTRDTPSGTLHATVTQVGASLREFKVGDIDLTEPYPERSTPPSGLGVVLVPWPNRVRDGRWMLDGVPQQLALTEPDRNNAIHGLLRYSPYALDSRDADRIDLTAEVFPQMGYPFHLDTRVAYALSDEGLSVTHTIVNVGSQPAPVAIGAHPYFKIGGVPTEDLTLTVRADRHFEVDERMNIVAEHSVTGTAFDLRAGRRVGDLTLDDGWSGVHQDADGVSTHGLTSPDGRSVTLWADRNFGYIQAFTSRSLATLEPGQVAVAIEPMTAPTNALNTGRSLRWLAPGDLWRAQWGIRFAL
jgi:aldose 1-epimerase